MSIFIFLVVLCVLILVHEWGHFIAAKKLGMRVDEFAIGFPPRLFAKRIGETLYSVNLFLIGGYVKILGEDGANAPASPVMSKANDGRSEAAEAGRGGEDGANAPASPVMSASRESLGGQKEGTRSFAAKPKWAQAVVLLAGVVMNIVLAWVLIFVVHMVGTQSVVPENERTTDTPLLVTEVLPASPADLAGVAPGSRIVAIESDGEELTDITPTAFQAFVSAHEDDAITVTYERKGELQTASITPQAGVLENEPERRAVGMALAFVDTTSLGPIDAFGQATYITIDTLQKITVGIAGLLWDAVQFNANLEDVAGPIGIVGLVGEASAFGITTLLMFTAFISLNLAVINLLPFPALDGGRLLFVAIESIKGSPIKPSWAGTLNTIGFILLIMLMLAVTYNDITRLI
jgi:regulator of sigma E protease